MNRKISSVIILGIIAVVITGVSAYTFTAQASSAGNYVAGPVTYAQGIVESDIHLYDFDVQSGVNSLNVALAINDSDETAKVNMVLKEPTLQFSFQCTDVPVGNLLLLEECDIPNPDVGAWQITIFSSPDFNNPATTQVGYTLVIDTT